MRKTKIWGKRTLAMLVLGTIFIGLVCLGGWCPWLEKDDDDDDIIVGSSAPYTFYGQVIHSQTGEPLAGKQISFYQDTGIEPQYDDVDLLSDYMYTQWQTLTPKATPDATTNSNGWFYANLPDGTYNMVISGSGREDEMEIVVKKTDGAKKRNCEVNENITTTNFNAEGHILYMGKYEGVNRYTCGQRIRFVMFGVNNGGTDETITFAVGDHTVKPRQIIYTGNLSNPDETLTVPAGDKAKKNFDWTVPSGLNLGKHDIHVKWNDKIWHKIGNFFVIADTTAPWINVGPASAETFTNQPVTIGYAAGDSNQPGTMPDLVVQIAIIGGPPDTSITVNIDKDICVDGSDGDITPTNDTDLSGYGGSWQEVPISHTASGYYTVRFTAVDSSGNTASKDVNISVYITEEEADQIATPFYTEYCLLNVSSELRYDYPTTLLKPAPDVTATLDMYGSSKGDPVSGGFDVGHEYNTQSDGLTQAEYDAIKAVESDPSVPEYVTVTNATTATEFNTSIYNYMVWLKNNGVINGSGLPNVNPPTSTPETAERTTQSWINGGSVFFKYYAPVKSVLRFTPRDGAAVTRTNMSVARIHFGTAVLDGKIYAIGGYNADGYLASAERYDPSGNSWEIIEPLTVSRSGLCAVAVNGKIYAIGGKDSGGYLTTVEVYTPGSGWTGGIPMPTARVGAGVCVVNDKIYIIGGYNGSSLTTIEVFDTSQNQWDTSLPDMTTARGWLGVAELDGVIYAAGGYQEETTSYLTTVETYNVVSGTWASGPALQIGRADCGMVNFKNTLYVIGGLTKPPPGGCPLIMNSINEVYHTGLSGWIIAGGAWWDGTEISIQGTPITPRYIDARRGMGTVVLGDYIYLIGGESVEVEKQ